MLHAMKHFFHNIRHNETGLNIYKSQKMWCTQTVNGASMNKFMHEWMNIFMKMTWPLHTQTLASIKMHDHSITVNT